MKGKNLIPGVLRFGAGSSATEPPKSSQRSVRGATSKSHDKVLGSQNDGEGRKEEKKKTRRPSAPNAKVHDIERLFNDVSERLQRNASHNKRDLGLLGSNLNVLGSKLDTLIETLGGISEGGEDLKGAEVSGLDEGEEDVQGNVQASQDEVQQQLLGPAGAPHVDDDFSDNDQSLRTSTRSFSPPPSHSLAPASSASAAIDKPNGGGGRGHSRSRSRFDSATPRALAPAPHLFVVVAARVLIPHLVAAIIALGSLVVVVRTLLIVVIVALGPLVVVVPGVAPPPLVAIVIAAGLTLPVTIAVARGLFVLNIAAVVRVLVDVLLPLVDVLRLLIAVAGAPRPLVVESTIALLPSPQPQQNGQGTSSGGGQPNRFDNGGSAYPFSTAAMRNVPAAAMENVQTAPRKRPLQDRMTDERPRSKGPLLDRLSGPSLLCRLGGHQYGCRLLPNLARPEFRKSIEESDVFFVQETHLRPDQSEMVRDAGGTGHVRRSLRICAQVLKAKLDIERSSPDILVLRIGDMHFVNAYVAGEHSSATRHFAEWQALHPWDTFSVLVREMSEAGLAFSVHGDLNGRSGPLCPQCVEHPPRIADDMVVSSQGRKLLALCEENDLRVVNGGTTIPGEHHKFTFFGRRVDEANPSDASLRWTMCCFPPAAVDRLSSMDVAAPTPDCSDHAATRSVIWVRMDKSKKTVAESGAEMRRADLAVPREDEMDEDLWRLMSEVMEAGKWRDTHTGHCWRQASAHGRCMWMVHVRDPPRARCAGAGMRWGMNSPLNRAFRVPGAQTNNPAELFAILGVLATTPPSVPPDIYTDSQYAINMVVHGDPLSLRLAGIV
ncbi:hypothetical protein R3P38DRAFT_2806565 [Favolaschia claudopus]|uniref:RNase H type-1 domain-containing protein n=1 Tax=Favolaschia claudopus TaxID=2862362 RepID=A0AAV9ZJI6_9AGAR